MNSLRSLFLLLSLIIVFNFSSFSQSSDGNWTQKEAAKWYKSNRWANGLNIKADKSVNLIEFAKQYHLNKACWDLTFKWLKENNPETVALGKYVIDGKNVTVNVTKVVPTILPEVLRFEDHCEYIDLQYIAQGKEEMDFGAVAKSTIEKPYNAKNDVGLYRLPVAWIKKRTAQPGAFLIFFPSDAHHTDLKVEGCDTVKKIVFKIKMAGLVDSEERQMLEAKKFESQK